MIIIFAAHAVGVHVIVTNAHANDVINFKMADIVSFIMKSRSI